MVLESVRAEVSAWSPDHPLFPWVTLLLGSALTLLGSWFMWLLDGVRQRRRDGQRKAEERRAEGREQALLMIEALKPVRKVVMSEPPDDWSVGHDFDTELEGAWSALPLVSSVDLRDALSAGLSLLAGPGTLARSSVQPDYPHEIQADALRALERSLISFVNWEEPVAGLETLRELGALNSEAYREAAEAARPWRDGS